jgi:mono/diheme cytochrome c family protein
VARRAADIVEPASLSSAGVLQRGAACYRDHCVQCHGGPGVARQALGMGMQPLPSALIDAAADWKSRELYWITRYGIKMSGMPAWEFRLGDDDLWAVVGFVKLLPTLSTTDYARRIAEAGADACRDAGDVAEGHAAAPSPQRGRIAMQQYACSTCHAIPGVTGAHPLVGPPLGGMAGRRLIAGRLANSEANMVAWLRSPKRFDPLTAMPDLGVTERDARDMAAYLSSLR